MVVLVQHLENLVKQFSSRSTINFKRSQGEVGSSLRGRRKKGRGRGDGGGRKGKGKGAPALRVYVFA